MPKICPCEVPPNSLLSHYKDGHGYADCYVVEVYGVISQAMFIEAFYTSPLFKVERSILAHLAQKSASDADVRQLANGKTVTFSAWNVEAQSSAQLLLADSTGRTRSWLMALPVTENNQQTSTLLYFGSAVVRRQTKAADKPRMGWGFYALLGFHRLYSRLLLAAASKRVQAALHDRKV